MFIILRDTVDHTLIIVSVLGNFATAMSVSKTFYTRTLLTAVAFRAKTLRLPEFLPSAIFAPLRFRPLESFTLLPKMLPLHEEKLDLKLFTVLISSRSHLKD